MKLKTIPLSIILSLGLLNSLAHAETSVVEGGTVHFTGKFVNATCAVSTDTDDQTVKLGQHTTGSITAAGKYTAKMPFNIKLVGCDTAVAKSASIAFYGTVDADDTTLLAVNSGSSNTVTATGVGIELLDSDSKVLTPNGESFSAIRNLTTQTVIMPFFARYKSTAAIVGAGEANADASFVVKYQ